MDGEKKQSIRNAVIKDVRDKLGISQQEMAEQMGISRGRLSHIERGLETPDWLIKFAILLRLLNDAGLTYEDAIMALPELRAADDGGEYRTD